MHDEIPESLRDYIDAVTKAARTSKEHFASNGPADLPAIAEVVYEDQSVLIPVTFISETEQMHPMEVIMTALAQIRADHGPPRGVMVCIEGYGAKTTNKEELDNYVRGTMAERFARGDPNAFEAVMITVADETDTVQRTLPFHYGDGTVQWDEEINTVIKTMSTEALRSNMGQAILGVFRETGVAN